MKLYFGLLIMVFLAFAGYRYTFRRMDTGKGFFFLTGFEFLVAGLLLGPFFFDIIDSKTFASLVPVTDLLLGWAGMLTGVGFEAAIIRRSPPRITASSLFSGGIVWFCLFFMILFFVFPRLQFVQGGKIIPSSKAGSTTHTLPDICSMESRGMLFRSEAAAAAAILAAVLAVSSPSAAAMLKGRASVSHRLLSYMAGIDSLVPVLLAGVFYWVMPSPGDHVISHGRLLAAPLVLAGVLILYLLALSSKRTTSDLLVLSGGMILMTSGAAGIIGFSPFIANFLMGAVLINISREKEKLYSLLTASEKPAYIILLVLVGASWDMRWLLFWWMALFLFFARLFVKWSSGVLCRSAFGLAQLPRNYGLLMTGFSGAPVALLFDMQIRFGVGNVGVITGAVLMAGIMSDILLPVFTEKTGIGKAR